MLFYVSGSLATLWLSANQIGDEGAKALAAGVPASASLAQLFLDRNSIGNEGAKALAEAIRRRRSIAGEGVRRPPTRGLRTPVLRTPNPLPLLLGLYPESTLRLLCDDLDSLES